MFDPYFFIAMIIIDEPLTVEVVEVGGKEYTVLIPYKLKRLREKEFYDELREALNNTLLVFETNEALREDYIATYKCSWNKSRTEGLKP